MSDPYVPQEYKCWQQRLLPLQADEDSPIGHTLRVGNHQQAVRSFETFTGSNDPEKAPYPVLDSSDGAPPAPRRTPSAILYHRTQRSFQDVVDGSGTFYQMEPVYFPHSDEPQTSSQGPNSTQDPTQVGLEPVLSSNTAFRRSQTGLGNLATQRAFPARQWADVSHLSVQSGQVGQIQRFASPFLAQTSGEDNYGLAYDTKAGYVGQPDYACQQQGLATFFRPETPGEDTSSLVYAPQQGLATPLLPETSIEGASGLMYGAQATCLGRPEHACHQQGYASQSLSQTPGEDTSGLVYDIRAVYPGQPDYAGQQQGFVSTLPRQVSEDDTGYDMRLSSVLPPVYPYQKRWIASQLPDQPYAMDLMTFQDADDLEDQVPLMASNKIHGEPRSSHHPQVGDVLRTRTPARTKQARLRARYVSWCYPKSKSNARQQTTKKAETTRRKKKPSHKDMSVQKKKVVLAYATPGGQDQSTVKVDLPWSPDFRYALHTPEVHDPDLFPRCEYARPPPIVTKDGEEEFFIRDIIDEKRVGRGYRYLVRWVGYGPEEDEWMPRSELEDTEALDIWLAKKRLL